MSYQPVVVKETAENKIAANVISPLFAGKVIVLFMEEEQA